MLGIREELLKTDKNDVKVRFCRGGTIEDTEDNTKSILKREPDYIILHVGSNNATNLTARDIRGKLLRLKSTILDALKLCKVVISRPTLHSGNGKTALTNHHFCNLLEDSLGGKGVPLNPYGTARLALNIKSTIWKL